MLLAPISSDDASLEVTSVLHELTREKRLESRGCLVEAATAIGTPVGIGVAIIPSVHNALMFYPSVRFSEIFLSVFLSLTFVVVGRLNVLRAMKLLRRRRELRRELAELGTVSRAIEDQRTGLQRAIDVWNAEFRSLSADLQTIDEGTTVTEKLLLQERGARLEEARRVLEPHLDQFRTQLPTLARAAILGKGLA